MPSEFALEGNRKYFIYNSAFQLPEKWNQLSAKAPVFFSVPYLKALEASDHEGFSFLYGLLTKDGRPSACLVFQLIDLSHVKIGSVIHAEPYGKFLKLASDKIRHTLLGRKESHFMLVHGSMYASGGFSSFINEEKDTFAALYPQVMKATESAVNGQVSIYITKDFMFGDEYLQKTLSDMGFIRFVMDPVMVLNIDPSWKSFEEYLQSLSSKYRLRAVNALEKTTSFEFIELDEKAIPAYSGELEVLYQAVIAKSPVRLMHPKISYIYQLKLNLKENCIVKAWFDNGKPVAFLTFIKDHEKAYAHHIGIDYHANRQHALYQNILYRLIEMAIENDCTSLDYGRTALEIKSTAGAIPVHHAAYLKMNSKMLNHLVKPFLPSSPPSNWVQRMPFRRGEN